MILLETQRKYQVLSRRKNKKIFILFFPLNPLPTMNVKGQLLLLLLLVTKVTFTHSSRLNGSEWYLHVLPCPSPPLFYSLHYITCTWRVRFFFYYIEQHSSGTFFLFFFFLFFLMFQLFTYSSSSSSFLFHLHMDGHA